MSKLDAVVCGLLSYQKKAPKQVWKDHGCNWQLRLENTKQHQGGSKGCTQCKKKKKKSLTSERKVSTTLEIGIITPYSEYGELLKSRVNKTTWSHNDCNMTRGKGSSRHLVSRDGSHPGASVVLSAGRVASAPHRSTFKQFISQQPIV